jgi:hypothetical protein
MRFQFGLKPLNFLMQRDLVGCNEEQQICSG